jgi:hypothetical protein
VAHFHRETVIALAELIAAAGLNHPHELRPYHFMRRTGPDRRFDPCQGRQQSGAHTRYRDETIAA